MSTDKKEYGISVIMPCYNTEQYVEETLKSVLNQSFKDYEIICLNDGSTDGTLEILKRYQQSYPNIRVISSENHGVAYQRNTGVQCAQGKYIYYMDSDDLLKENCLETLYQYAEADNLDVVYFEADSFYETKEIEEALNRVKRITGKEVKFYKGDISDIVILDTIFKKENIESCIHFAGLKSVGESVAKPLEYYQNNIAGTLILLQKLREYNVKNIIFSSSATVYGDPAFVPITEECPKGLCTNPYGWSKSMLEQILMDIYKADETWNIILLRYFNPIGAHKSGLMGENPNGIPNNLMPYVTQVAVGKLKELGVFGNDYDTPDGTGVRDYIHVVDLAKGHVKALQKIDEKCGFKIYNLGTGKGYSVLDIVKNFEAATGMKVPYVIKDRRPGDIATCYCDPGKAAKELDWKAENGIKEMCEDSWRWQKKNPNGYEGWKRRI